MAGTRSGRRGSGGERKKNAVVLALSEYISTPSCRKTHFPVQNIRHLYVEMGVMHDRRGDRGRGPDRCLAGDGARAARRRGRRAGARRGADEGARGTGPQPPTEEIELPKLLVGLRDAGGVAGADLGRTLSAPAQLREASQAFQVLHQLARAEPADRPARLVDVDAPHSRGLSLGEEHRERLRAIRERLSRTDDELREEPAGINTAPSRRRDPAARRQSPG